MNAATARGGEDPYGIGVSFPVLAEQEQGGIGEGDVTILAPLAMMDVNELASAIDVADLKVSAFLQAQAAGVESGETTCLDKPWLGVIFSALSYGFPMERAFLWKTRRD
jgi:hypothetical protein